MTKFIRPEKVIPYALAGFLLAVSQAAHAAFATYGGKITESDKLSLPPVCRLILFEKPSAHQPEGQRVNGELFNRPEYRMAKNNIHLHHYCYGQLSKHRYFTIINSAKRAEFAGHFQSELDYVLRNSDKDWPYFDQLYFEQAEMLFYTGNNIQAISKAFQALAITPGHTKAHALLSDIYIKIGKRDMALKQLHEGLATNPYSKLLRRKLSELDPKDPILAQPLPAPPQPNEDTVSAQPSPANSPISLSSEENKSTSEQTATPQALGNPSGTLGEDKTTGKPGAPPPNPYCRFCP